MSRALRKRYGHAAAKRHLYEVHFDARHPSRPALRTQTMTSVAASSRDDAISKARAHLTLSGWLLGEPFSVVKRFAIREEHQMHGHARHNVQTMRAFDPHVHTRPTREITSLTQHATVPGIYPALIDEAPPTERFDARKTRRIG